MTRVPAPLVWPLVLLAELALLAVAPVLLAVAAALSPLLGGRRPLRAVVIVLVYVAHHIAAWATALPLQARRHAAHAAVLRRLTEGVVTTIARAASVSVHVSVDPAAAEALHGDRPLVVLGRHAGEGDTLVVLHELLRHGRRPRVVMHHALRLDPLIALIGDRLPHRFVDPGGGDVERHIAAMAADMGPCDAVVIFPEGRNFSAAARERGIARLVRSGFHRQASAARAMRHVSAPRPGGALAAVEAAPDGTAVLVVAHVGFPEGAADTWRRLPEPQHVEVAMWLADPPPADGHEARVDWLFDVWGDVDRWVAAQASPGGRATT